MSPNRKPVIAIVGANKCSKKLRDMAAEVGRYVAEKGGIVVCGGLGGIMEGAAQGAREGKGLAIGFLPSDDPNDANEYIDVAIPTGMGEGRNVLLVRAADVVVAFPGKYGTLSEMALTLQAGKPLISVHAWSLGDDVVQAETPLEAAQKAMELAGGK